MDPDLPFAALGANLRGLPAAILPFAVIAAAVAAALALHALVVRIVRRLGLDPAGFALRALHRVSGPTRLAAVAAALILALSLVEFPGSIEDDLRRFVVVLLVVVVGWILLSLTRIATELVLRGLELDAEDNLKARQSFTQIGILTRSVQIVIVVLTLSAVLVSFDSVRQWGVSLLASAGVAGLVIGLAARPLFANLIAGVQIALTQPIRVDDVVIIENEWGWIEEIGATFVTVRLWDWRRLIVPLSQFIEQPFQNWTRQTAAIIGQVTWHLDYAVPVEAMRAKLTELARDTPLWDGKVVNLQVVEALERTVVIRALVSARNSPTAWDLRCEIREKMLVWLQETYPQHLPKFRTESLDARPGGDGWPPAVRTPPAASADPADPNSSQE